MRCMRCLPPKYNPGYSYGSRVGLVRDLKPVKDIFVSFFYFFYLSLICSNAHTKSKDLSDVTARLHTLNMRLNMRCDLCLDQHTAV